MPLTRVEIEKFNKVLIVYNRNSGKQLFASMFSRVNEIYKHLKAIFGSKRIELCDIKSFGHLDDIAERVVFEQIDWVIIAGGDGTIRALIEKLANRNYLPYISVFPAGTVNLVAKELLMSTEPTKWVKRISKGIVAPVYLGRTNGHVFLTVTGIGFDSLVVHNVTEESKKLLNKMAYVVQGAELIHKELAFKDWQYKFEVRFDDEEEWHQASSVIVGKSRYYAGRYSLFNGATLGSPQLHVALFTGNTRNDFMRYAACIAMEALHLEKSIVLKTAQKLEIRCNVEDFAAELDGDAITAAPLTIEIEKTPVKFLA
ncbi:MAG: diacylglycerol kinase family protein [Bacteroidia bacterium]|nr:diacylglycerol kinase family protein [Bacteroidia bacterium]